MAAEGLSNREIAEALFVSTKTIEASSRGPMRSCQSTVAASSRMRSLPNVRGVTAKLQGLA